MHDDRIPSEALAQARVVIALSDLAAVLGRGEEELATALLGAAGEGRVQLEGLVPSGLPRRRRGLVAPGGRVLAALAKSGAIGVLRELAAQSRSLKDLELALSGLSSSTLRSRLTSLVELGAVGKREVSRMPRRVENELTVAGRDLLFVIDVLEAWLAFSPRGPLALAGDSGRGVTTALSAGWDAGVVQALAVGPRWVTDLSDALEGMTYPSLERRLTAMRNAGQVERVEGGYPRVRYGATEWLRRAVGVLFAAMRWEWAHLESPANAAGPGDLRSALELAVPLVQLGEGVSGRCRLAGVADEGGDEDGFETSLQIVAGSAEIAVGPEPAGADVQGSLGAWFDALVLGESGGLEVAGLGEELLSGLHRALFYRGAVRVVDMVR